MKGVCCPLRLRTGRPNPKPLPGSRPRTLTPLSQRRDRRSHRSLLQAARTPSHLLRPRSLRITRKNSIMLLSTSPALDCGRPRIPKTPITLKSGSTEIVLDLRIEISYPQRNAVSLLKKILRRYSACHQARIHMVEGTFHKLSSDGPRASQ